MPSNQEAFVTAAQKDDLAALRRLWESGVISNIDGHNDSGDNAMIWAATKQSDKCLRYLLANGASPNTKTTKGAPALYIAAVWNRISCAQALIDAGADPAVLYNGHTPETKAREKGFSDLVLLLKQAVDINPEQITYVSTIGGQEVQEIFHFGKLERFTYICDPATHKVNAAIREKFSKLDTEDLKAAFAVHAKRGGKVTLSDISPSFTHKTVIRKTVNK